jgi:WD40 repeat protein
LSVDFCEPNILATSSYDTILIWNMDSGFPRHTLSVNSADNKSNLAELSAVEKVLFLNKKRAANSPYVPLLSCGNDGYIRIWDTQEGKHIGKVYAVPHAPGESVVTMAANRENTVLVSGDSKGFVRVWDISNLTLDRHSIHHHHQLKCSSY